MSEFDIMNVFNAEVKKSVYTNVREFQPELIVEINTFAPKSIITWKSQSNGRHY